MCSTDNEIQEIIPFVDKRSPVTLTSFTNIIFPVCSCIDV